MACFPNVMMCYFGFDGKAAWKTMGAPQLLSPSEQWACVNLAYRGGLGRNHTRLNDRCNMCSLFAVDQHRRRCSGEITSTCVSALFAPVVGPMAQPVTNG